MAHDLGCPATATVPNCEGTITIAPGSSIVAHETVVNMPDEWKGNRLEGDEECLRVFSVCDNGNVGVDFGQ